MRALVASVLTVASLALGCAVQPSVSWERGTFEGFDVISYMPAQPRAVVFVFHGTNGSASFVDRVETTDVLNRLVAQGYGFVSTSSTERTGDRRWDVTGAVATNPDLARLARLRDHLVATTPMTGATPLTGIGMSNGSRFVTLWGQTWKAAGLPVRAIWASMGRIANPVSGPGELTVPTVFSTAENDFTVPPAEIFEDAARTRDAGTPMELYVARERRLTHAPFLRIPGIDEAEAQEIVRRLVATGVWRADGTRAVADVQEAAARASAVSLPASVASQRSAILDQVAAVLAVHQFTAEFAPQVQAFFGRHLP